MENKRVKSLSFELDRKIWETLYQVCSYSEKLDTGFLNRGWSQKKKEQMELEGLKYWLDPKRILELWIVHLRNLGNQKAVDLSSLLPDKTQEQARSPSSLVPSMVGKSGRIKMVKKKKKAFAPCNFPYFLCSIRTIEAAKGMLALLLNKQGISLDHLSSCSVDWRICLWHVCAWIDTQTVYRCQCGLMPQGLMSPQPLTPPPRMEMVLKDWTPSAQSLQLQGTVLNQE